MSVAKTSDDESDTDEDNRSFTLPRRDEQHDSRRRVNHGSMQVKGISRDSEEVSLNSDVEVCEK